MTKVEVDVGELNQLGNYLKQGCNDVTRLYQTEITNLKQQMQSLRSRYREYNDVVYATNQIIKLADELSGLQRSIGQKGTKIASGVKQTANLYKQDEVAAGRLMQSRGIKVGAITGKSLQVSDGFSALHPIDQFNQMQEAFSVKNIQTQVSQVLGELIGTIKEEGVKKLLEGVHNQFNQLFESAKSLLNKVETIISKQYEYFLGMTKQIVNGIGERIESMVNTFTHHVKDMVAQTADYMIKLYTEVTQSLEMVKKQIVNAAIQGGTFAKEKLEDLRDFLKGEAKKIEKSGELNTNWFGYKDGKLGILELDGKGSMEYKYDGDEGEYKVGSGFLSFLASGNYKIYSGKAEGAFDMNFLEASKDRLKGPSIDAKGTLTGSLFSTEGKVVLGDESLYALTGEAKVSAVSGKAETALDFNLFDIHYNKDGTIDYISPPSVDAKAEASATGLKGEVKLTQGNQYVKDTLSAEGKVLNAEAKANASFDLEKGKIGAEAKVGASVLEGTVKKEINILGVKINVGVTGKALSASASAGGYVSKDGVKANIGASLGIGADVEIGINWGDAVDNFKKWMFG